MIEGRKYRGICRFFLLNPRNSLFFADFLHFFVVSNSFFFLSLQLRRFLRDNNRRILSSNSFGDRFRPFYHFERGSRRAIAFSLSFSLPKRSRRGWIFQYVAVLDSRKFPCVIPPRSGASRCNISPRKDEWRDKRGKREIRNFQKSTSNVFNLAESLRTSRCKSVAISSWEKKPKLTKKVENHWQADTT